MPEQRHAQSWRWMRPSWQRIGLIMMAALLALPITSCSADESDGDSGDVVAAPTQSACESAVAAAASIGDMEDTVEDLDPAIRACKSVDEWIAANDAYPDALDGVDPVVYLTNRCLYGEGLESTDLCKEAG